jgi:hypothetical protein
MVNKKSDSFSKIIKEFDPSDSSTSTVLKGILNTYPFFQSASAYFLKTLKVQKKDSFNELLPKTAILTHNRSILRNWIYEKEESKTDQKFDKIEKYSFLDWFDVINENESNLDYKINLIDNFIKNSPKININKEYNSDIEIIPESKIKDDLITETLAKIYINQKKYNKAIKAYNILGLKYPKKSSFFADQIERIKNLKKNNN